ncbi:MAG: ABC transporter ATP-binding protein [Nitrospirota bacterium]|jgi:ABC-2 type transport system ATP-binding protein
MNDAPAIRAENLTKVFGGYRVLDGLNLDIKKGEIYGLVGPDGAGKTTIMRILAAVLDPTSGAAWVTGHPVLTEGERIKEKIGYMSQRFGLYEDLTVMENILFYADLYDVPKSERPERIERLLGFSNLTPFKERLAGRLSGGMKQKLGLACALIHTPEVLFLDEPTNGVDPVSRRDFWRILYGLLKEGITIFVSTAYLDEAERCTRIGLIHEGKLLLEGDPAGVRRSFENPMVSLWTDDIQRTMEALKSYKWVLNASIYGDRLHVTLKDSKYIERLVSGLPEKGIAVKGYREIVPSLEDIFIAKVSG